MLYADLLRRLPVHRLTYKDAALCAAIALYAFLAVGICYKIMGLEMAETAAGRKIAAPPPPRAAAARAPEDFYAVVARRNLFGVTEKIFERAKPAVVQRVALSSLLQVWGTVAGDDRFSFAVIEERGRAKQGLYHVGDRVAGATIVRITRDRVVMKYEGREEMLKKAEATEAPIVPAAKPVAAGPAPVPPPATAAGDGGKVTINRSDIASSLKDLGHMLSQAQIRQHFTAGAPDGFIVSNIQQGSLYQRLGLVNGDVIQELNNHKIQGADDIIEMYNTMKSGSTMLLKVKRQGKQETFDFAFR
jgi:general secretion pathway protein C